MSTKNEWTEDKEKRLENAEFVVNAMLNTIEWQQDNGVIPHLSFAVRGALANYCRAHCPNHPVFLKARERDQMPEGKP